MKYIIVCLLLFISQPVFADSVYTAPSECSKYIDEIEKYNWSTSTVIKIMEKESSCNPTAVNWKDHHKGCDGSFNLLQVACIHYKEGEDTTDVSLNIKRAYEVYINAGKSFKPWSTCKLITLCS